MPGSNYKPATRPLSETIMRDFTRKVAVVDENYNDVPDHEVKLPVKKLVVIEGMTFRVAYTSKSNVVLEPVSALEIGR